MGPAAGAGTRAGQREKAPTRALDAPQHQSTPVCSRPHEKLVSTLMRTKLSEGQVPSFAGK